MNNTNCCAPMCSSRKSKNPELTFHLFPVDERRKKRWILALRIGKSVTKHMRVCSKHFDTRDFCLPNETTKPENRKKFLRRNAIPSKNLPVSSTDRPIKPVFKKSVAKTREASCKNISRSSENDHVDVKSEFEVNDHPILEDISSETPEDDVKSEFKFSDHPTLEDIRALQLNFVQERNWEQYHQPRNLLLAMVGEVGELSEIFQWKGEIESGLTDWSEEEKEHLGQELSDVLLYLIRLSEKCHIDLPKAVLKKMKLNEQKYPVSEVRGSSKKYTEYKTE